MRRPRNSLCGLSFNRQLVRGSAVEDSRTPLMAAEQQFDLSAARVADQEQRVKAMRGANNPYGLRLASDLLNLYRSVQSQHYSVLYQEREKAG